MKLLRALFTIILLIAIAAGAFAAWVWNDLHLGVAHESALQPLEVRRGENLEEVLQELNERGVISTPWSLRLYLKIRRENPLVQAGNYYFPSPITPLEVLAKLKQGAQYDRITVIEGWTRWDIAEAMAKMPALKIPDTATALSMLDNASLIHDIDPDATNLEGYLYPDTYFVDANSTGEEVVAEMVKRFREIWDSKLKSDAQTHGMNVHEVVTVASIIETEAKLKSERPIIASVIKNRIVKNMPLSMDSTLVYASKMAGTWKNDGKVYQSDIDRQSPYNTRKHVGLPPGPVGSPGLDSLQAAVNPGNTDFLYYVRNPDRNDGAHNFYTDAKGFEEGVAALRAWEAKQQPAATPATGATGTSGIVTPAGTAGVSGAVQSGTIQSGTTPAGMEPPPASQPPAQLPSPQ